MSHRPLIRVARRQIIFFTIFILLFPLILSAHAPTAAGQTFLGSGSPSQPFQIGQTQAEPIHLLPFQGGFGMSGFAFYESLLTQDRIQLDAASGLGRIAGIPERPPALPQIGITFAITATDPISNALDIAENSPISVTFNAAVNRITVDTSSFFVHGDFSGHLNGLFEFSDDNYHQGFYPEDDFKPGELVQVSATSDIADGFGAELHPKVWSFTTSTADAGAFMAPHPISPTFGAENSTDVGLGDLDGDGDLDAIFANTLDQPETVWLNNGSGLFSSHPITPTFGAMYSYDVALGDLDADGDLDAVFANVFNDPETVWINDGTGGFFPHPVKPNFGAGYSLGVTLGDLDGDGDLDAVVANMQQPSTVWLNGGLGSFNAHPIVYEIGSGIAVDIALGDLDGDGDLDAVIANYEDQAQTVWLNDGTGSLTAHPITPSFGVGYSIAVALGDLDGDGDLDAVIANDIGQPQTVWVNDGLGSFTPHPSVPSFGAGDSLDVKLGDIDGDGDLDAVIANNLWQPETVWLNDGTGSFTAHVGMPSFGAQLSNAIDLGDLDGDGDLDAVVANNGTDPETVWLNQSFSLVFLPIIQK